MRSALHEQTSIQTPREPRRPRSRSQVALSQTAHGVGLTRWSQHCAAFSNFPRTMKTSFVAVAVVAALAAFGDAAPMQAGSCAAAKCPPVGGNFCSASSVSPAAFTTNFKNECECLKAKCLDKKVQCYAKAPKCDPKALLELKDQAVTRISPVCASNGVTYDNYFQLKVGRALDPSIQFLITGKCPTTIAKCVKKKCPSTREKICALEAAGKAPVFYQNQCYYDIGLCLNPKLTVSKVCPKSKKTKSLSADASFALTAGGNETTTAPTPASGSGSSSEEDEPAGDEIVWSDADEFYVGEDLMAQFESNTTGSGSSNGTITTPTNKTTTAPNTKPSSAATTMVSLTALAVTALALV
ncbi:hypothetical protein SDRG_15090 [Saprolegnia diclina VS20]|uniref:Secreted protein n=1 Tax=Saprolegnia diclina (strain VS20) TaxID=1156394 RepID=T0Q140_SAPDV|nr:hypothetical protein SDRG_15090 [Saprolegnia diclina VS20]EQC27080.1 hypothetical protein SDRG_15090 [Saprolegnia diclina VS20]|eukprot:XP_008619474.1 hypothetical protein SDRG_15090 [Saprolegnia diclina VS20]